MQSRPKLPWPFVSQRDFECRVDLLEKAVEAGYAHQVERQVEEPIEIGLGPLLLELLDVAPAGAGGLLGLLGLALGLLARGLVGLGLLLGARSDAGWVRDGADRAELTAEFTLTTNGAARDWLREHEADVRILQYGYTLKNEAFSEHEVTDSLAAAEAEAEDLTAHSRNEQRGAGLDRCRPDEFAEFQHLNEAYRMKFGFPFIVAVKGLDRRQILEGFRSRLQNTPATEFREAVEQVIRIGYFRLEQSLREEEGRR